MTATELRPLDVAPAPTAAPARPGGRRRGRGRPLLWVGGALVALAAVALALVRSIGVEGPATIRFAPDAEAVSLPAFEGGTHALRYRHGGTVSFAFPIRSTGLLPSTVASVRIGPERHSLLVVEDVTVDGLPLPARLGRGETATVEVTARYANCRYYHERELQTLAAATVETSAMGVHVTRTVPFDHPLVVPSPMIVECPERTLVRDDDVRR